VVRWIRGRVNGDATAIVVGDTPFCWFASMACERPAAGI
jgi:hypothetical protein